MIKVGGNRRYGFHGLSYAWTVRRAAEVLGRSVSDLRLVMTHLGGGGSVCATTGGRSVSTSMGFTPLEGMAMVKRSGTVDPGMLLWLQTEHGLTAEEVSEGLEEQSGLDALVFTGQIGANTPWVRESVAAGLGVLGVQGELDPSPEVDGIISSPDVEIPVLLVHPHEELQIADEVQQLLPEEA